MKKLIFTSAAVVFLASGIFAQDGVSDLVYRVGGRYNRPVTEEILQKAGSLADLIPDYPVHWINDYVSVEILANVHGKVLKARGTDAVLTGQQKNILDRLAPADDLEINIKYRSVNVVTQAVVNNLMHTTFTVVPETRAGFTGGDAALDRYLKDHGIDKVSKNMPAGFKGVTVRFTVDERGVVTGARVSRSSGSAAIDRLLLDAVRNMPRWKPAENAKGEKVKQEFEFNAGKPAEGC